MDYQTSATVFPYDYHGLSKGVNAIACSEIKFGARQGVTSWLEHHGCVFGGVANLTAAYRDVTVCGVTMDICSM